MMWLAHHTGTQSANGFEQSDITKRVSYSLANSHSLPQVQHMLVIWLGIGTD
jgi:hypothetical protein